MKKRKKQKVKAKRAKSKPKATKKPVARRPKRKPPEAVAIPIPVEAPQDVKEDVPGVQSLLQDYGDPWLPGETEQK
jgi:hypothetical protein